VPFWSAGAPSVELASQTYRLVTKNEFVSSPQSSQPDMVFLSLSTGVHAICDPPPNSPPIPLTLPLQR